MAAPKMTKNQKRRAKKKADKVTKAEETRASEAPSQPDEAPTAEAAGDDDAPKVENDNLELKKDPATTDQAPADGPLLYDIDNDDPAFSMFKDIFSKFGASPEEDAITKDANAGFQGVEIYHNDDDDIPDEDDESAPSKMSKKKRKMLTKLSIAELKALVRKPEVVEWHDTSSSDPRLLVQIKAQRNVVPVPTHWAQKREYLSSKRGIEKAAFKLPKFIADTGIAEMRDAVLEKQADQSLKQKQRERVQGKMGKLDIDYQKLYDAFFRFQDKPTLTRFGEVYYEGKEYETDLRHLRPGDLSESLKDALSIPPSAPPPWLINQQRFGPPPSYPSLRIPGLNAPIPAGAQWGFNPGCYGKPPVDEYNRPLFGGDIFGIMQPNQNAQPSGEPVERSMWGELQEPEEESEEEEDDEDDEDEDEDEDGAGMQTPSGLDTPADGLSSSVPVDYSGTHTESVAGEMDLRKNRRGYDTEESSQQSAYTVIPERQQRAEGFFGSDRVYDLKQGQGNARVLGQEDRKRKKPGGGDVDVALDPEALGDKEELQRRFEDARRHDPAAQPAGVGAGWHRDEGESLQEMITNEGNKRIKLDEKKREERRGKYKF